MPAFIDRTGHIYGSLTVTSMADRVRGRGGEALIRWSVTCKCGKSLTVSTSVLSANKNPTCGCSRKRNTHGFKPTHGRTKTKEYQSWKSMLSRCYKPRDRYFKDYGGRGVAVCDEWRNSFEAFFSYLGESPSPAHTVDRFPDKNGNYEPGNCRWATPTEQSRNKRNNRLIEIDGVTRVLAEWSEISGIASDTIAYRLRKGQLPKTAVFSPLVAGKSRRVIRTLRAAA